MSIYNKEKYGFVYIWHDTKKKMYYVGSHWGTEDDGYICSSNWMYKAYKRRPYDFKRKIIKRIYTNRIDLLNEEDRFLKMMKPEEMAKSENKQTIKYYNVHNTVKIPWHATEQGIKTVGEKISASNKGKPKPCSPEKARNISKAKKENFAKKQAELGYKFDPEHIRKVSESRKNSNYNYRHSEEWKQQNSIRMKDQWSNGTRKRAEPKQTMTLEEQSKLSSERMKSKWSDPEWKEKQRKALSDGAKSRPPRTELTKQKMSDSQKGKPKTANRKTYQIEFLDGATTIIEGLTEYAKQSGIPFSSLSKAACKRMTIHHYNIKDINRI